MKIENRKLQIDVIDLLNELTGDDRRSLIDTLSCESDVIAAVCQQIVDGWTWNGSHGAGSLYTFSDSAYWPLESARRWIAKSRDAIADQELKNAEKEVARLKEKVAQLETDNWKLKDVAGYMRRHVQDVINEIAPDATGPIQSVKWNLERIMGGQQ